MDIYSSYQVDIEGGGSNSTSGSSSSSSITRVMTRVADSPALAESSVAKLHGLVSGYYNSNKINKKAVPVGLSINQTDWNYYCSKTQKHKNMGGTLQLCFSTSCVILQLLYIGSVPRSLTKLLADETIVFVGKGIRENVSLLKEDYGLECNNVIELGPFADRVYKQCKYHNYELGKLASEIAGLNTGNRLGGDVYSSSWAKRDLDTKHIEQATAEAYASYLIGDKLLADAAGGGN